jgi:hypothetical protein
MSRFYFLFSSGERPSNAKSILATSTLIFLSWGLFTPSSAFADSVSFQITNPSQPIQSGQLVVFQGTVTNDSGLDLTASDFFFNFFNFDLALTPNQLLGTPDFLIPNNTTSPVVDLFNVAAGVISQGTPLSVDTTLEDIFNDVSAKQTVILSASGGGTVPEPAALMMLGTGIGLIVTFRRTRRLKE